MGTLVRLLTILNHAKDSSTHYHIAEILLKNFARLENMTILSSLASSIRCGGTGDEILP